MSPDNLYPRKPEDAQYYRNGMYYKVGRHCLLYHWLNGHWIRSAKDQTRGKKSMKDARFNKILGMLQSAATEQINIVLVNKRYQIISGDKLLLELSLKQFDKLSANEILKKAGVPIR